MQKIATALFILSMTTVSACTTAEGMAPDTDAGDVPNFEDALVSGDDWALMPLEGLNPLDVYVSEGESEGEIVLNFLHGDVWFEVHVNAQEDFEREIWNDVIYELDRDDDFGLKMVSHEETERVGDGWSVSGLARYNGDGLNIQILIHYDPYREYKEDSTVELIDALRVTR